MLRVGHSCGRRAGWVMGVLHAERDLASVRIRKRGGYHGGAFTLVHLRETKGYLAKSR